MSIATNDSQPSLSPDTIVNEILKNAIKRTLQEASTADDLSRSTYLENVRGSWLRSLREAFAEYYGVTTDKGEIAVFGGKPRNPEEKLKGAPTGIFEWRPRWEFQYDVAVFEVKRVDAPFKKDAVVPVIIDAIWLVESEIAGDGTQVGEDASKLRVSRARNTLLIAARSKQPEPGKWLKFLGSLLSGLDGAVYIALVPSYASSSPEAQCWIDRKVDMELYQCFAGIRYQNGLRSTQPTASSPSGFAVKQSSCCSAKANCAFHDITALPLGPASAHPASARL